MGKKEEQSSKKMMKMMKMKKKIKKQKMIGVSQGTLLPFRIQTNWGTVLKNSPQDSLIQMRSIYIFSIMITIISALNLVIEVTSLK